MHRWRTEGRDDTVLSAHQEAAARATAEGRGTAPDDAPATDVKATHGAKLQQANRLADEGIAWCVPSTPDCEAPVCEGGAFLVALRRCVTGEVRAAARR
jgi:hypothetical protein